MHTKLAAGGEMPRPAQFFKQAALRLRPPHYHGIGTGGAQGLEACTALCWSGAKSAVAAAGHRCSARAGQSDILIIEPLESR